MSPAQEEHLESIKTQFTNDLDKKYRAGQKEHGGDVWLKDRMLDNALDEVLDLAVYLYTLKQQLKNIK